VGEVVVRVLLIEMLIVTNAVARRRTKSAVIKSATKLTKDTAVYVIKDTNSVGSHVLKFVAIQVIGGLLLMAKKSLMQPVRMDET